MTRRNMRKRKWIFACKNFEQIKQKEQLKGKSIFGVLITKQGYNRLGTMGLSQTQRL